MSEDLFSSEWVWGEFEVGITPEQSATGGVSPATFPYSGEEVVVWGGKVAKVLPSMRQGFVDEGFFGNVLGKEARVDSCMGEQPALREVG